MSKKGICPSAATLEQTEQETVSSMFPCIQSNTDNGRKQGVIEAALPHGAESAVPARVLAEHFGFRSVRQLQKAVEAERRHGAIILSKTNGGYYAPADGEQGRAEIAEFVRTLDARARHTQAALRSARAALRELDGQQIIEGA